mgnify:FL=1|tara:strand:- start:2346 stop:3179 length:834 start_codon:yes stop_codon:yes gene_type:complete
MFKNILYITLLIHTLLISACSNKEDFSIIETNIKPDSSYLVALNLLDKTKYDESFKIFQAISKKFPLSNEGIQSKIMLGFIEYLRLDYNEAVYKFEKFINQHPAHKNLDYVYYIRALCFYEQLSNEELDNSANIDALTNFKQIINRFPESKYITDSKQKIILINENIAAKNMNIAYFYLEQKNYMAALNRYNLVINEYSTSKFTPEALYRLVEIYYILGLIEDAKKTTSVIAYNYPKSKWYVRAYDLVNKDIKIKNKKTKNYLSRKIFKLLSTNDKE